MADSMLGAFPMTTAILPRLNLDTVSGPLTIGTGAAGKQRGAILASTWAEADKPLGCLGKALRTAADALSEHGGGVVEILPGTYDVFEATDVYGLGMEVRCQPGVTINIRHGGAIGLIRFATCTASRWQGGKIVVKQATNDQVIVKFQDGFENSVDRLIIDFEIAGSESNPMIGLLSSNETESTFDRVKVLPRTGVIGVADYGNSGVIYDRIRVSNGVNQNTLDSFVAEPNTRNCYIGFDSIDSQFTKLRSMRAWGLGTIIQGEVTAVCRFTSDLTSGEDGHSTIDDFHAELCATKSYISLEGVFGWLTINNPEIGYSNYAIGELGQAAIKVTRSTRKFAKTEASITAANADSSFTVSAWDTQPLVGQAVVTSGFSNAGNNGTFYVATVTSTKITVSTFNGAAVSLTDETSATGVIRFSRNSARIKINGGRIHNVGRSRASGEFAYLLANGSFQGSIPGGIASGVTINVTGTNTFALASGTWHSTPVAGQWVRTSGFTDSANNGNFKIVSADNNEITVAATLVDESGTGNEVVVASYPYEGSAIWIEYASCVSIDGVTIEDQRHQWGISIDPLTARGITIGGGTTIQRGSGSGAVAAIRIPDATLPNIGSGSNNLDDTEGIGLGEIWLKSWGSLVAIGNASVSASLAATAPTITETNAAYLPGLLTDNSDNYSKAGSGDTAEKLTTIRRLG